MISRRTLIGLAIGFLTSVSLMGCDKKPNELRSDKAPNIVSVVPAELHVSQNELRYSASINPAIQVDLAFKVGGYINNIYKVRGNDGKLRNIQEGDFVGKGTVLALVRQIDYQTKVRQYRAALKETYTSKEKALAHLQENESSLEEARLDYDRANQLFASSSLTKPDYDAAKAHFEINQAKVKEAQAEISASAAAEERLKAQLDEAMLALNDCALKSPIAGVILKRNIEEGSYVSPGNVGFIVADVRSVKAEFGVPDLMVQRLCVGNPLTITTEASPGMEFHGYISRISPTADPRTRVFEIEVTVPNDKYRLKVGMIASLSFNEKGNRSQIMAIPLTAIVRSQDNPNGYSVFVVEKEAGKLIARRRAVELGDAFGNLIAVVRGIKLGERVVTVGSTRIMDGEEVQIAM